MENDRRIIISFTSYPARMKCIKPLLETLVAQTRPADKIVMYLAEEEFPNREGDIPKEVLECVKNCNKIYGGGYIEIRFCERNLRPHKKYFYAFRDFPDDLVVTVDDDMLYPPNLVERLYESYKKHPECVSAWRVHTIAVDDCGKIMPHKFWTYEDSAHVGIPSHQHKATGVGGVLYPVHLFKSSLLDERAILETCLNADDLWLMAMELYCGVPVVPCGEFYGLNFIPGGQETALSFTNDLKNMNDVQLENISRYFLEKYGFSLAEKISQENSGWCGREYLYGRIKEQNGEILRLRNELNAEKRHQFEEKNEKDMDESQLLAEIERLKRQLDSVQNSRSWKITRPLRLCGKIARKARRVLKSQFHKDEITNPDYLARIADNRAWCAIPKSEYPERLCEWYREIMGENLNLKNPATFNEKLNWLKLFDKNPLKTLCADKLRAPKWAKKRCPELHTVRIIKSWKRASKINFAKLPEKFALKCNHGSGMNIIVTDKKALNIPEAVEKLNFWMQMDYAHWNHSFEAHYSKIPRRIICEEYIESAGEHGLTDYKIHCFNGNPRFIQVIFDRNFSQYGYSQRIYDLQWNDLHIRYDGHEIPDSVEIEKPACLEEMLSISKKLSEPFRYVRVDLYIRPDGIYFGEMTFTPAMGAIHWEPPAVNDTWGGVLELHT